MNPSVSERICKTLPESALVLDVGGGAAPWSRADWVIDSLPFEQQGRLAGHAARERGEGGQEVDSAETRVYASVRHSPRRWVQQDLCDRRPWPFGDREFDFVSCTHVLEDVRDPVWVCSEMRRVGRRGYIETPSRAVEQSLGVEHPCYAGFYHHRWLVSVEENVLVFRLKPHLLHTVREAIVVNLGARHEISPEHANMCFEWSDDLACREALVFDERMVADELCSYAGEARRVPGIVRSRQEPWSITLRRWLYYRRLTWEAP